MIDPNEIRRTLLNTLYHGLSSHVGSCMSTVDILTAIFSSVDIAKIRDSSSDRSRVIVSKGHCSAALYSAMTHFGLMEETTLATYQQDDSVLAGHVSHGVDLVEHSTGSLGHGISVACGCAVGLRSRGFQDAYTYALLGDGELMEGSVWEAMMFIAHHKLNNLITLVDDNRISGIAHTAEVMDLNPLRNRFEGFGLQVLEVDGHDVTAICDAIISAKASPNPTVIVCNTIKGYGLSFAEDQPIWHYRPLAEADYKTALRELDGR